MKFVRYYTFVLLVYLLASVSCDDGEALSPPNVDGTYKGIFYRSDAHGRYESSQVTIIFEGGHYSGESSLVKYPALCKGTYSVAGNLAKFENKCFWTAEFDWSLILTGEYSLDQKGDSLKLTGTRANVTDTYILARH